MKEKTYTQVHLDKNAYTHQLDIKKVRMCIHALSRKEKRVYVGELTLVRGSQSLVFEPMVLDHGTLLEVLIPSIGSVVLVYYGFGPWYCGRPKTIKEEGDHVAKYHLNYH